MDSVFPPVSFHARFRDNKPTGHLAYAQTVILDYRNSIPTERLTDRGNQPAEKIAEEDNQPAVQLAEKDTFRDRLTGQLADKTNSRHAIIKHVLLPKAVPTSVNKCIDKYIQPTGQLAII